MFIIEVTVVLYFIKILSGSRNFYRLRMTSMSLTSTNVFTISCLSIDLPPSPPPRPGKFSSTALVQSLAKSLLHYLSNVDYSYYSSPIRGLFADYSYYSSTIRGLFVLFVDYSLHYSSFINCPLEWVLIGYIQLIMRSVLNLKRRTRETCKTRHSLIFTGNNNKISRGKGKRGCIAKMRICHGE